LPFLLALLGLLRLLRGLPARIGLGPILLEDALHLPDDSLVVDDDADLAALLELELPQALTADERAPAVADDRADVQPLAGIFFDGELVLVFLRSELADDPDVDAGFGALREQPHDGRMA